MGCRSCVFTLVLSCRVKANCPLVGPGPTRRVSSVRIFLRDPCPYLCKFQRKTLKTPNGLVDKRDWELNPASPVYQIYDSAGNWYIKKLDTVHYSALGIFPGANSTSSVDRLYVVCAESPTFSYPWTAAFSIILSYLLTYTSSSSYTLTHYRTWHAECKSSIIHPKFWYQKYKHRLFSFRHQS